MKMILLTEGETMSRLFDLGLAAAGRFLPDDHCHLRIVPGAQLFPVQSGEKVLK